MSEGMSADPGQYATQVLETHHQAAMRLPIAVVANDLRRELGPTLVAYMANVRSRQLPPRWGSEPGDPRHVEPRDAAKQRLLLAHVVFGALAEVESPDIARAWLIGANPRFGGRPPAERIREYDATAVMGAARSFIETGGGQGD